MHIFSFGEGLGKAKDHNEIITRYKMQIRCCCKKIQYLKKLIILNNRFKSYAGAATRKDHLLRG